MPSLIKYIASPLFLAIVLTFCWQFPYAQDLSNIQQKIYASSTDTIQIDSSSLLPNSVVVKHYPGDSLIPSSRYQVDHAGGELIWQQQPSSDSVRITYRVLAMDLDAPYFHKDIERLSEADSVTVNPFAFGQNEQQEGIFEFGGLDYNGSFARGLSFGNKQDVILNSSFNLQLSGMITEDIEVAAAITDSDVPVQPEGNTQNLQQFDKVYITLTKDQHELTVGDYELGAREDPHFMNFFKKLQGASYDGSYEFSPSKKIDGNASFAVSKGKFAENRIEVEEGNQGPYKLRGADGESFIVVLAGTERVYVDGKLMKRGEENDYVIDYNLGEITFTSNVLVTKDLRVRVEFQYSKKKYLRTTGYFNGNYKSDRLNMNVNVYTEQDNKNQPLREDLKKEEKQVMRNIGDNIDRALISGVDTVDEYDPDRVLYKEKDTVVGAQVKTIYEFSTDEEQARFALSFAFVGDGEGSYTPSRTTANGRAYKWVGEGNGSYEPARLLVTPKSQQMATVGMDYQLAEDATIFSEVALSNYDRNTFSSQGDRDDQDIATKVGGRKSFTLSEKTENKEELSLTTEASYEFTGSRFKEIERYRPVEFQRNWNLQNPDTSLQEQLMNGSIGLSAGSKGDLTYDFTAFLRENQAYQGFKQALNGRFQDKGFRINGDVSYLKTNSFRQRSTFFRPTLEASKGFSFLNGWRIGARGEQENNRIVARGTDTLANSSFLFNEFKFFLTTPDTMTNAFTADYTRRIDYTGQGNAFAVTTIGDIYHLEGELLSNPRQQFRWNANYRRLTRRDSTAKQDQLANHYLGRLEYTGRFFESLMQTNVLYELGSGREQEQDFVFIKDPEGEGVYLYKGDLNENGVKDVNEFEIAPDGFEDEAKYVRVNAPTNEFVPVNTTQFNQTLSLRPRSLWFDKEGVLKFLSRFSSQTSLQINRKVEAKAAAQPYNPFGFNIPDSLLVSINSTVRNSIFFNRSATKYGLEYTWRDTRDKYIVTNGSESKGLTQHTFKARWNIQQNLNTNWEYKYGNKTNEARFAERKSYNIQFHKIKPSLTVLFFKKFRTTASYKYTYKENMKGDGNEFAVQNKAELDMRYNVVSKSTLNLNFSYTAVGFEGDPSSNVGFAMLQGLQDGNNYMWKISYDRQLSDKVELSLSYDGRKTGDSDMVHTGRAQIRALF